MPTDTEIRFRSDIGVTLCADACCGSDATLVRAARAVAPGSPVENVKRTLAACMKLKHNSVFEHGLLSVYVEAPGVVWWQLTRQRFMSLDSEDFSFNLESGRYKVLDGVFYLPPLDRPCLEPDGFKPMRPILIDDEEAWAAMAASLKDICTDAWQEYSQLVARGVAREVARLCLPNWALYCAGYVTGKPLTWLQFFSKRRKTVDTQVVTFPQWEIENFAEQCEAHFAALFPLTYAAFNEFGRIAP